MIVVNLLIALSTYAKTFNCFAKFIFINKITENNLRFLV